VDVERRNREQERRAGTGGLSNNPVLSFVPWVIFWVVAGPRDWELGVACALIASVVLLLLSMDVGPIVDRAVARSAGTASSVTPLRLKAPKLLDVGTTIFFLALVIAGAFVDRSTLDVLENYAQAISSGALALIVTLSIAVGHPFTEQYARERVPEEQWHTPLFRRTMLVMSGVWALIFVAMAILGTIAQTGITGAGSSDWLNWYIPIALVVVGMKFNAWYPARVRESIAGRQ
jgi:hypothetical protein